MIDTKIVIERKKLDDLIPHPKNPRIHPSPGDEQWETLKESLSNVYYDPLVVNKRNGMLVSGHLRRKIMQSAGCVEADVVVIDVDEPTHVALLMSANNNQGRFDNDALAPLIKELQDSSYDLKLTGFTDEQIEKLLDIGSPLEVESIEIRSKFEVVVECADEQEQEQVFSQLNSEGKKCRLLTF